MPTFNDFVEARAAFRQAKREKNYALVIAIGERILEMDGHLVDAEEICIAVEFFLKDIGRAHQKLGNNQMALACFQSSKTAFIKSLNKAKSWQKSDWQNEIRIINNIIAKTEQLLN